MRILNIKKTKRPILLSNINSPPPLFFFSLSYKFKWNATYYGPSKKHIFIGYGTVNLQYSLKRCIFLFVCFISKLISQSNVKEFLLPVWMFCSPILLPFVEFIISVLSNMSKSVTLASEFFLDDERDTGDKFGITNGSLILDSGNRGKNCMLVCMFVL